MDDMLVLVQPARRSADVLLVCERGLVRGFTGHHD